MAIREVSWDYTPQNSNVDFSTLSHGGPAIQQAAVATPASADYSGVISAGIGAAGQTASTIAQIAGQQAALDAARRSQALGIAGNEKLAKMQIEAEREIAAGRKQDTLRNLLLSALQNSVSGTFQNRDLQRAGISGMDEVLANAFLRPKRRRQ